MSSESVGKQWSDEKFQITLVSWLFVNLFAEVDDVILGYIFTGDFFSVLGNTSQQDNVGPLTLGIVAFFSVRGLYLWLFNLAFIVYLFIGARALHKYLNEQVPNLEQAPIESWPTLDDFHKSSTKTEVSQDAAYVNTIVPERVEYGQVSKSSEQSVETRWPSVNGRSPSVRALWPEPPPEEKVPRDYRERRTRSRREREVAVQRQDGIDNPAYEAENRYYVRLQNDTGSSHDYEEYSTDPAPPRRGRERERGGSQQWELPRDHGRARREVREGAAIGHYTKKTGDSWSRPPPPPNYQEEIPIPPVDYLDPQQESPAENTRTLSLQQAILDKSLRLKKVPDELKKGLQK